MSPSLYNLSTGPLWSIRAPATLDKINPTVDKSSVAYGGVTHTGQDVSPTRARGRPSRHLGFSLTRARRVVQTIAEIEAEQHGTLWDNALVSLSGAVADHAEVVGHVLKCTGYDQRVQP